MGRFVVPSYLLTDVGSFASDPRCPPPLTHYDTAPHLNAMCGPPIVADCHGSSIGRTVGRRTSFPFSAAAMSEPQ